MENLDSILRDPKKTGQFLASILPWEKLIDYSPETNHPVLCPFHDDHSPSAKIFKDEDGVQRLWCFTENRQYSTADYVRLILKQNLITFLMSHFDKDLLRMKAVKFEYLEFEKPIPVDLEAASELLPNVSAFLDTVFFGIKK